MHMCVCCTYIRAHGRLVSVLMTYLNAALTLMMLLLIHIDQVHNTLYWWSVINRACFLHFSFLNLHLCVLFSSLFVMVFAKQEGQITNPDAQRGDCIFLHFSLLIFNFPFCIFNFGMNFIFYFHFLLFLAWLLQGGKGRLQTQMLRLELIIIPSPHWSNREKIRKSFQELFQRYFVF